MAAKSGATKRREKHERDEAAADAALDERTRKRYQRLEQQERKAYRDCGEMPDDPLEQLKWVRKMTGKVCRWTGTWEGTPGIKASRRLILESCRSLGMTAIKAINDERVVKLEDKVYGRRKDAGDGAPDGLEEYKPPT